ncbi:MAG: LysR family transcriptional regulator [Pseudomonadota bacterium]
MDFPHLRAFASIAETGSVSRAAERLHLTQPSISKRLAGLEQQLKQPLFDRVNRRMSLTDAGRAFLPHARRMLQELEDARRALSHLTDDIGGRLSIGTSHHIGLHRLPPVLRRYTQRYPVVDLDIHFMDSEIACEAVLAGKLELGIVTLPSQPLPQLKTRKIWDDPLDIVVNRNHPLAGKKKLKLTDLADHPAVLPDEATYTHRIIKRALQKHGLEPRIRLATNYLETLKMLAGINLGWSVLPRSMLDKNLRVLKLPALRLHRDLGAVWHEKRTLSAAAQALLKILPS